MRDKARIKPFLEEIEKIWSEVPDWRFGQLICNFERFFGDLFFLEENDFINKLKIFMDCNTTKFICSYYDEYGKKVVAVDDFCQDSIPYLKKLFNADEIIKYSDYPKE